MPLTITDGSTSVDLMNTQANATDTEANVISVSLFSTSPEDTFLLPLTAADEATPDGLATGPRLSSQAGYSGDPVTALGQYLSRLESFADGAISSLTLSYSQRGQSINGLMRSVSWSVESGAPLEASWSVEFVRGHELDFDLFGGDGGGSGPESVSPSTSASLAGYDLGEISTYRVQREQDITTLEVANLTDSLGLDDNLVMNSGGVTRTFAIEGRKTGSESALTDFENAIKSRSADTLNTVTYNEAFPGRSFDVAIQNFSPERLAGQPGMLEYSLELIEGTQLGDLDIYQELTS